MDDIIDFVVKTRPDIFTRDSVMQFVLGTRELPDGEGWYFGGFKFSNVGGGVEVALNIGTVYNDNSTWSWIGDEDLEKLFKLE